ncbi:MAG TPA: capsid protein, partial [Reyranella sp.]|nr:capsid protein [Reyranella sp.]
MRPNIAVIGQQAWTKLRRHPKIVQAVKGTAQGAGIVSRQEFADLFELQGLLVGAGFVNTAKKGQTASLSRVWGKHMSLIYRDRAAGPQAGVTFGFTAQFGDKIAGDLPDERVGLTGSTLVRSGERVKECISASDVGYFFQNCVA